MLLHVVTLLTLLVGAPPANPPATDITPRPELMAQARALADAPAFAVPAKDIARWPAATEPFEMLLAEVHLHYDDAGRLTRTSRMVYRLNHTHTIDAFGTREFEWAAWHQDKPKLEIRVITPSGEERRLDPSTISERVGRVQNQVIDDRRTLVAALPGLTLGAVVEEVFTTTDTRPAYPGAPLSGGQRFFANEHSAPVQRLVIDAATAPTLATANWSIPPPTVERRGDRHLLTLEVKRAGTPREPARLEWSFGGTWQDAANAYAALIADPAKAPAPSELTRKGLGVAATMKLVADKMRYTGLSLGEASVVPYPAPEVWKRGYGDCKDVSLLVVNALEAQGVKASLALLRAGEEDDILPTVAGLDRFNHAIVYVHPQGDRPALWIDTTAPELSVGVLPDGALERWALIVHPTLGASLIQTPSRESQPDAVTIDTHIEARPMANALVRETVTWAGSIGSAMSKGHDPSEPAKKRLLWVGSRFKVNELLTAETRLEGDRFIATTSFDAPSHALAFEEGHFYIDHYAHLFHFLPAVDGEPLRMPRRQKLTHHTRIVPPPGFVIATEGLGDQEIPLGPATWRETFTRDGDALVARAELDLGKLDWTKAEAKAFSEALKPFQESPLPTVHVVAKSRLQAERGELVEAFSTLREAITRQPKDAETRARTALLLAESGLPELARVEIKRALADAPGSRLVGYGELFVSTSSPVGVEFGAGYDRAFALATARKMVKLYPSDYVARLTLAQVLIHGDNGSPRLGPDHAEGLALLKELALEGDSAAADAWLIGTTREARWQDLKEFAPKASTPALKNTFLATGIAGSDGPDALKRALPTMTRVRSEQAELVGATIAFLSLAREYDRAARVGEAFARDLPALAKQIQVLQGIKKLDFRDDYSTPEAALGSMIASAVEGTLSTQAEFAEIFTTFGGESLAMGMDVAWGLSRRIIDGDDASGWRVRFVMDISESPVDLTTWWRRDGKKLVLVTDKPGSALGIEALRRHRAGDIAGAVRWFSWWLEHAAAGGTSSWTRRWPDPKSVGGADLELGIAALAAMDGEHAPALSILDRRYGELPSELRVKLLGAVAKARGLKTADALRTLFTQALGDKSPETPDWMMLISTLSMQGYADDALRLIEERQKASPADPTWQHMRAFQLMRMRRYDESATQFAELRRAGRVPPMSLNNEAWMNLMRGQATAETAELAQRATTQPGAGGRAAQNTLALIELERGNIAQGIEAHRKSIVSPRKLEPHDELVRARIADRLGFRDWAKTVYERLTRGTDSKADQDADQDVDQDIKALSKRYLDALPKR